MVVFTKRDACAPKLLVKKLSCAASLLVVVEKDEETTHMFRAAPAFLASLLSKVGTGV